LTLGDRPVCLPLSVVAVTSCFAHFAVHVGATWRLSWLPPPNWDLTPRCRAAGPCRLVTDGGLVCTDEGRGALISVSVLLALLRLVAHARARVESKIKTAAAILRKQIGTFAAVPECLLFPLEPISFAPLVLFKSQAAQRSRVKIRSTCFRIR
jgi:hypothetical protein